MPKRGQTMLYRPVPRDFTQVFVQIGWYRIEKHYHAHAKTIKRWLIICGYDGLREARAAYVKLHGRHRREGMIDG